ncbi:MAG: deaminase [Nocardioidaceae bacterium]
MSEEQAWNRALTLAWEAFRAGTTPVGAVVTSADGSIVAAGRGRRYEPTGPAGELANVHIAHAEINALARLDTSRHWEDHRLLTTLEPCGMCHGAAVQATLGAVSFAGPDPYGGTATLTWDCPQPSRRPLEITGPLPDSRGAFATLLHIVWLMERGADHVVAEHSKAIPDFTDYAMAIRPDLVAAAVHDDYPAAWDLCVKAPW